MNFYQNFTPPTITFCESNIHSWIVQPANTWSNLPMIFVGIVLFFYTCKSTNILIKLLPWIMILIGLFSFIYHATYTFIGQFLDLGSMFLLASYLIVFNLQRLKPQKYSTRFLIWTFIVLNLSSYLLVYFIRTIGGFNIGIPIFAIQILIALILEYKIRSQYHNYSLKYLYLAILSLFAGQIFWWLDYKRIWCNPAYFHIINGHAIWHIFSAICFILIYLFYRQFEQVRKDCD